jgi:hypothetical protein
VEMRAIDLPGLLLQHFSYWLEDQFHVSHSQIGGQLARVKISQLNAMKHLQMTSLPEWPIENN